MVGGKVSREKIKTPFGGSDIDVIGPDGSLIAVGGPAKAKDLGKLGTQLKVLKSEADSRGVPAKAAFEEGTPQSAIDFAKKKLGPENVFTFPKEGG
jgi:filamentous hemagglutinin